jgi:hypothetical protein
MNSQPSSLQLCEKQIRAIVAVQQIVAAAALIFDNI